MFTSLLSVGPAAFAVIPRTLPELAFSRMIFVILCFKRNCAPFALALFSRARTSPEPGDPLIVSFRSFEYTLVTTILGTVPPLNRTGFVSLNWTPFSTRNSKVATFSSAQARSSGAHDDDIRSMVPSNSALRCGTGFGYARTSQSRHSNTKRGTVLDEFSAANVEVFRFLAHVLFSSLQIKTFTNAGCCFRCLIAMSLAVHS